MKYFLAMLIGILLQVLTNVVFHANAAEGYMTFLLGYIACLVAMRD
jgi:hypothetical protein